MISLCTEQGDLIRHFSETPICIGYHPQFGFITESSAANRSRVRALVGLKTKKSWLCKFKILLNGELGFEPVDQCTIERRQRGWELVTPVGNYLLTHEPELNATRVNLLERSDSEKISRKWFFLGSLFLSCVIAFSLWHRVVVMPLQEEAPLSVHVIEQKQKTVSLPPKTVPAVERPKLHSKAQNKLKSGGAAVDQSLGFLSLLGRSNLRKAVGGNPSGLKNVSAGAGLEGDKGSGGEYLMGLGQGVTRATVGNTGVKGLGGIGNSGSGGGAGGYGNGMIGSGGRGNGLNGIGNGRSLADVALAKDMVLEGGLDEGVIQATIAKYLSQVRACYEQGLRSQAGLTGQVTMGFEIGGEGRLTTARVKHSSLGHVPVEQCIVDRMMTWQFPKPLGGVQVKVSYPFVLRPTNHS